MSVLDVCLIALTVVFWGAMVLFYFRLPILEWVDQRTEFKPLSDWVYAERYQVPRKKR